jgi:hypothetical protein
MKTRFKTYMLALPTIFLIGALYGALLDRCLTEGPVTTGPATVEDLAKIKASMTSPLPAPPKDRGATNVNPASRP